MCLPIVKMEVDASQYTNKLIQGKWKRHLMNWSTHGQHDSRTDKSTHRLDNLHIVKDLYIIYNVLHSAADILRVLRLFTQRCVCNQK